MKGGLKVVYTSLFTISIISSCALFLLVVSESSLPPVVDHRSNEESNKSSFITKESNDISESPVEQLNDVVNSDQNNVKDSKPDPQPTMDNTLAFSEALSQNSGIPVGLPEAGQAPIVISLVDTATLNLQENIDSATPTLFSNYSDQKTDTNIHPDNPPEGTLIHALDEGDKKDKKGHKSGTAKEQSPLVVLAEERKPQLRLDVPISKEPDHIGEDEGEPVDLSDIASGNGTDVVGEEKPTEDIPSFSEWTQKQLEEAEKHDTVLNDSTHTSQSNTIVSNKNFNVRSKNYASPACGAKVIAVNPEAGSASSMLSPNKDEYMLNTCNSRIWFVVELCEPIQAQKIELANFELFSSTPKDFAVYFSDRYPTRDWTSVGQFTAKDERDVQSFDLFPHLFGKFIKVEFFSHYGSEHYCPISMFKAYGTSEFEVLEKENSHPFPLDDDDDILEEVQGNPAAQADISKNLFGSVRDAVMSIMKKAAQVLVKTGDAKNITTTEDINKAKYYRQCCTPSHILVCDNCSDYLFSDVFELMSCKSNELKGLIENAFIYDTLRNSDVCEQFGLDLKSKRSFCFKTERALYLSAVFMPSYLAALCNMLAIKEKKVVLNASYEAELRPNILDNISSVTTEDSDIDEVPPTNTEIVVDEGDKTKPNEVIIQDIGKAEFDIIVDGSTADDFNIVNKVTKESEEIETSVKSPSDDEKQKSEIDIKPVIPDTDNDVLQNVEGSYTNSNIKEPNDNCPSTGDQLIKDKVITLPPVVENKDAENSYVQEDRNNEKQSAIVPEEVNVQEPIPMDHELSDLDQLMVDPIPPNTTPSPNTKGSNQAQPPQAQKESVFLRLSNRVKALERNMSLSGQYLEELSRRYKKQVEEMQKNFEKTLLSLSEERKKSDERAQRNVEQMILLQQQLNQANSTLLILMEERDSWFGRISFFKFILYQSIIVSALLLYLRRPNVVETPITRRSKSKKNQGEKNKVRRKSVEGVSGHRTPASKKRRPSEEALRIARLCTNDYEGGNEGGGWVVAKPSKNRRRKISVLHKANPLGIRSETSATSIDQNRSRENIDRQDSIMHMSEDTITLEEQQYVAPGIDPVEFNSINGPKINDVNGISPTQEMSKANGSINKITKGSKPGKTRRLSSPAFFRSALSRQSSRSTPSPVVPKVNKPFQFNKDDGERQSSVSPSGSICSSAGDMSLENNSVILGTNGTKQSKKKSFKNIFKKVF